MAAYEEADRKQNKGDLAREASPVRDTIQRPRKPVTLEDVKKLMQVRDQTHPLIPAIFARVMAARKQILQDTNEQVFEDSTELIRQMRMERSDELELRRETSGE